METCCPGPISNLPGAGRIPALDGIRGVAILLVMLHHFTWYGGPRPPGQLESLFYEIGYAGWCGVDLFFVLSGFLITGILLDTKGQRHFFRNFYFRRFLRIFPLYFGVLSFMFLILPRFLQFGSDFQQLVARQGWYWSYLTNVVITGMVDFLRY